MRKPRQLIENARYHVTARANRKEFIFASKAIKELFLSIIEKAKGKYKFTVNHFCIMSNHVHLIIKPGKKGNLSKIMQWILSVFARRYNMVFDFTGHVWYDRFKSKILISLLDFIRIFHYISDNPVKAGIVNDPDGFKYSGLWCIRNGMYHIIDPPDVLFTLLQPWLLSQRLLIAKN